MGDVYVVAVVGVLGAVDIVGVVSFGFPPFEAVVGAVEAMGVVYVVAGLGSCWSCGC